MKIEDIDFIIPIITGTFLVGILLVFIIYFVLLYRKKQEEYEWEKEQTKQLLLTTKIEIKEQTMSNISRELHDNIGQMATLVKMNLSLFNYETEDDKRKIDEATDITDKLIIEIKELSTTIKGENLERFGLLNMIDKDIARMSRLDYIKILRTGEEYIPEMDHETEIYLYRMTQEIFNNVLQHSGSTEAILNITNKDKVLTLTFKDNGKGFDSNTYKQGSGLINLEERCKLIDAKFNIESQPNQGTIITISLKINIYGKPN